MRRVALIGITAVHQQVSRMRFKVDENLPAEVAKILLGADHEAMTLPTQGLTGAPDAQVLSTCEREHRALITLDLGLADIRAYPPESHSGLIVLRLQRQDKPTALGVVARLLQVLSEETLPGHPWIVDEQRVRIRGRAG